MKAMIIGANSFLGVHLSNYLKKKLNIKNISIRVKKSWENQVWVIFYLLI